MPGSARSRLLREAHEAEARADERARAARLASLVQSDLDQADLARRSNKVSDARAALERAEGRLTEGDVDANLRARAEGLRAMINQARKDQEMRDRLDQARIEGLAWGDDIEINSGPQLYSEAFTGYGLDVEKLSPAEAADRIRASALRKELVVALDGWARYYPVESGKISRKGALAARLLEVAEKADDDAWARRLRSALQGNDQEEVKKLAESPEAKTASPSSCLLLADALNALKEPQRALEVLMAGLQAPPRRLLDHDGTGQDPAAQPGGSLALFHRRGQPPP